MKDENIEIKTTETGVEISIEATPDELADLAATPYITAGDVVNIVGLSRQQVNNLASRIPGAYQTPHTRQWLFPYTAIRRIQLYARMKTGRPKKK